MDAVKYIKEQRRMCEKYPSCSDCPLKKLKEGTTCGMAIRTHAEETVAIVEKWSKEHPLITNWQKVKALLPIEKANVSISPFDDCVHITIAKSWWDAPYEED